MTAIKSYAVPLAILSTWAVLTIGMFGTLARPPGREPVPVPARLEETIVVIANPRHS